MRDTCRYVVGRPPRTVVMICRMGRGDVSARWLVEGEQVSVNAIDKVNLRLWVWGTVKMSCPSDGVAREHDASVGIEHY